MAKVAKGNMGHVLKVHLCVEDFHTAWRWTFHLCLYHKDPQDHQEEASRERPTRPGLNTKGWSETLQLLS